MTLFGLPTEVLRLIIQATLPEGFENFTLTCRRIYALCEGEIPKHNQLRRAFRHFRYKRLRFPAKDPPFQDGRDIWSSLALLHAIGQEPLIARYIVTADLKGGLAFGEYTEDSPECLTTREQTVASMKATGSLLRLLEQSPHLREAGEDARAWFDAIVAEDADMQHADTFLLTLLPNAEKLSLHEHIRYQPFPDKPQNDTPDIWKVLDAIPRLANKTAAKGTPASLSKLTVLEPTASTGYDCRYAMQTMTPFLALDSLRSFHGGGLIAVDDNYTGKPFDPRYADLGNRLEAVELAGCCMTARECAKLTKHMHHLRSFKLSYETKWHGCGHDWSVGQFVAALAAGVGATLRVLSLSISVHYGDLITGVTDLRGFEKLTELELETALLLGPPYTRDMGYDEDLAQLSVIAPRAPRLLDLLPPSLEKLDLLTDTGAGATKCLQALFTDFVAGHKTILPRLASVRIHRGEAEVDSPAAEIMSQPPPLPAALRLACECAGVEVVDTLDSARAEFMSTFEQRFGVHSE